MLKRKYEGVPTQEEINQQYNEIVEMTKEISTLEQVLNFKQNNPYNGSYIDIEINYDVIGKYNNEPIEVIRYEYKNILVYVNISDTVIQPNPYITLYDDEGDIQFADELYNNYDGEIERVAKMGYLELIA